MIKNLSKGYKQRVGIVQALIGNPKVIIFDEPTIGLDPQQIIEIRNLIRTLGKDHTVILSTHILPEAQAVCDRIIIVNKGVIAADGTATEIANKLTNEHKMTVRIEGTKRTAEDKDEIVSALKAIDGIKYVRADMEREKGIYDYDIESDDAIDVRRAINSLCRNKGWNILMLQLSDMTLEDIFMKITTGTMETIKTTDSEEKKNVLDDYNIGVTGGMDINKAEDIEETEGGDE
jgi:ABC-2 type transport system ATP-binding protein